ncbi:hypothetical protein ACJX0J_031183, partial [Zea mays]
WLERELIKIILISFLVLFTGTHILLHIFLFNLAWLKKSAEAMLGIYIKHLPVSAEAMLDAMHMMALMLPILKISLPLGLYFIFSLTMFLITLAFVLFQDDD